VRHPLLISLLAIMCLSLSTGCKTKPEIKNDDEPLVTDKVVEEPVDQAAALAHVNDALVEFDERKWHQAEVSYRKAVDANPKDWTLRMEYAVAQSKANNFLGAISSIREAMDLGGEKEWITWYNLGNIYQNRGMYYESIQAYRVSVGLDREPNMDVLVNLSSSYLFLGKYDDARETLAYILSLEPGEIRALHNNAMILHLQRKHDEALVAYDAVLYLEPSYPQTLFNKAHVLSMLKRYRESAQAYEGYIQADPNGAYVDRARTRAGEYRKK
jgi:tetratricopeptide (TPR) repeat protein